MDLLHPEFVLFLTCAKKTNLRYMVIGGYAVNYYGYNRNTPDLDVWLAPTIKNREAFINTLLCMDYSENELLEFYNEDFTLPFKAHIGSAGADIDILTVVHHSLSFDEAEKDKVIFEVEAIAFGYSKWFWFSFLMLFVCGTADNVSVVVRHTLVQLLTPNEKRGRVSAVNNLFIGTSNELGEVESGTVAHWFGPALGNTIATGAMISVVSGGVGTILVVLAVAWLWPEIRKYGRLDGT